MAAVPMVDLVGVGLNATDMLIPLSTFPARGSKVEFTGSTILPGGQAASTVVACQTWGLATRYVGRLGDDDAARLHRGEFARAGVDARIIEVPHAPSPQSVILVDGGGERTVLCRRDERLLLQPADLHRDWITRARILHVDGFETAAATQAARWARESGIPVVADLDETYPGVEELIQNVDYLIVSRDFPTRLTGHAHVRDALACIRRQYGCRLAAATLGEAGVLALNGDVFHHRPAFQVRVVDTTGAGDIFHAGFIYGLLQGWDLDAQLDYACAAAALNCTFTGARGGIRMAAEVHELMANTPRYPVERL